ncbi:MAG: NADP-dependent isocitrate dehydrogenase [Kiritimatiellia bacterium]
MNAISSPETSTPAAPVTISIARGDGIGPEIMDAVLKILAAAGARLELEEVLLGKQVYEKGISSGMDPAAWDSIRKNKVLLKAPITTPQGGGVKSLNVTLRKTLGLYANIRPCESYAPYVPTHHPGINMLIVRENEEDTYAGIEHQQTDEVVQCLKLITRPGCERIVRYAFEIARAQGRKKITCMTKDNIMKLTDGLFHRVFDEISPEYPDIETEHMIIDIGAAKLASDPERFDLILAPNLYGDILSDIAAEVAGSVGIAGSANIGRSAAMFEAIHGSAPDIAGQDKANPSALLRAAVMMLVHIGQPAVAATVENAWLRTLEDGMHTVDIASDKSVKVLGTRAFAQAVIERLGQDPQHFPKVSYPEQTAREHHAEEEAPAPLMEKKRMGIDVFLHWNGDSRDPNVLGPALSAAATEPFLLKMITNRGVKVYPEGLPETFCTDHWRCRFLGKEGREPAARDLLELQLQLVEKGFDIIKTENLYTFDGERAYSLGQGE